MSSTMNSTDFIDDVPTGPLDLYRKMATFDWKKMKLFFEDPELLRVKIKVWETLQHDPIFQRPTVELTTDEIKYKTAVQMKRYCQMNFLPNDIAQWPYKKSTRYMMIVNEALAAAFPDVSVKYAIGISLFKNMLATLGTERHKSILNAAWQDKILTSFSLTEVAHGSNTKSMRTTAIYDKTTQEFVINTPDFQAAKCWAGNLGKTCTVTVLFAQLYTNGECHGLHAFIVPVRDPKTLIPYPGIIVGDIGEKAGLHGVDNGFLIFNNYRIPRENLLNRTADVTVDGDYESSFSEPGKILGAALQNLSVGRIGIMQESCNNIVHAVTIAVRYAAVRKQFSLKDDDDQEVPIIEYQLHQWRLFPYVAAGAVLKTFVNAFTTKYLTAVEQSHSTTNMVDYSEVVAEIHAIVSSAKPLITWTGRDSVQECREACGGHGFLKAARLGDLRNTADPCVTYEGDNNVLVQQCSNWLLRQWTNLMQNQEMPRSPMGTCTFLENFEKILNTSSLMPNADLRDYQFIRECFEWLLTYLIAETYNKRQNILRSGKCRTEARNESQVYGAAIISRAYAEFNAIREYFAQLHNCDMSLRPVLNLLGVLYALICIDKHLIYFYQGGYCRNHPQFSKQIKDEILCICGALRPEILGVIDALAPPDFVVNSVLGNSDGKLYDHLQAAFFRHSHDMSRPDWWQEIIVPDTPDLKIKSKL